MKKFIVPTNLLFICVIVACSNPDSKFLGKWQNIKSTKPDTIIIEKKGEAYDVYHSSEREDFMTFTYDKDHDVLTMEKRGDIFDITYVDSTKHLLIAPRTKDRFYEAPIELEKLE